MRVCPHCRNNYDDNVGTCPDDGMPLLSVSAQSQSQHLTDIEPGTMVGDFMVEDMIGRGGMGVIYRGIHPVISKRVAIKVLGRRYAADPNAVSRFVLEARAVNEIGHHNIVDIFSIGELADGRGYLVMDLLDGVGLDQLLPRVGRFAPGELLPVFEQVCDALDEVHAKKFIHRDLKPENLFVLRRPPRPQVKVLDFGIAKLRDSAVAGQTEIGVVLGTPEYMSPEQCQACTLDATSDVYALGITLYELVTGEKPFSHDSPMRVLSMHIEETPPPPSELAPVSPNLEKVILKALGKHPSDRQASAGQFFEELKAAVPEKLPWTTSLEPDPGDVSSSKTMPPFPMDVRVQINTPAPNHPIATADTQALFGEEDDVAKAARAALEEVGHDEGPIKAPESLPGLHLSELEGDLTTPYPFSSGQGDATLPGPGQEMPEQTLVDPPGSTPGGAESGRMAALKTVPLDVTVLDNVASDVNQVIAVSMAKPDDEKQPADGDSDPDDRRPTREVQQSSPDLALSPPKPLVQMPSIGLRPIQAVPKGLPPRVWMALAAIGAAIILLTLVLCL